MEKDRYIFKIIPKEEFQKFIERFKDALEKIDNKKGEKKNFDIEINGTRELSDGIQIELFSFDERKYADLILDKDEEKIKNSLYFISLDLNIEKESSFDKFEKNFFPFIKQTLEAVPIFKNKIEIFLTKKEAKVSIYLVGKEGELINSLLSLGLDFTEYHSFNFVFYSLINFSDIFGEWNNLTYNFSKLFSLIFSFKSESIDFRYLLIALTEALKDIKITDLKIKKKYEEFINFLYYLNILNKTEFQMEFNAREFAGALVQYFEKNGGEKGTQLIFTGIKFIFINFIKGIIFNNIKLLKLENIFKEISVDNISLSLSFPNYHNGFALVLYLPYLTEFLDELFEKIIKNEI